jgi:predicted RNA polymerase sigma factor
VVNGCRAVGRTEADGATVALAEGDRAAVPQRLSDYLFAILENAFAVTPVFKL